MSNNTACILFFLCLAFIILIPIYFDYREDIFAMQHGYIQKVVNNKIIWVKDTNCTNKNKGIK